MNQEDLEHFLSHLAVDRKVSATTQAVPFNALLSLFRHVPAKEISSLNGAVQARIPRRRQEVLTPAFH